MAEDSASFETLRARLCDLGITVLGLVAEQTVASESYGFVLLDDFFFRLTF